MAALVTFAVADLERAMAFYDRVVEPLGLLRRTVGVGSFGYVSSVDDAMLLAVRTGTTGARQATLDAPSRAAVDAVHFLARAMGGNADAVPGPWQEFGEGSYAVRITDPEGHQIDIVHRPGSAATMTTPQVAATPAQGAAAATAAATVTAPPPPAATTMPAAAMAPKPAATARLEPLLEIKGLKTHFKTDDGMVRSVDGVDITVHRSETVGIVGESGCGKTVTAMSVLKLIPMPPGQIVAGEILYQGRDLVPLGTSALDEIRSKEIAIVFQEPMTSLNPVYTIGEQIAEVLRRHEGMNKKQAADRTMDLLSLVQISNPARRINDYPHQFSGGMRQRVMIAMALACNPKLLIADEPTTALDVTIQAQILDLMQDLKERFGMAIMLITHAMGVVAEVTQRVVVMYAGRVVEEAPVDRLFANPRHPYTQGLIRSIPRIDLAATQKIRLEAIAGTVPSLLHPPPGCRFAPRCKFASAKCLEQMPPLKEIEPGHKVACVL